MVAASPVAWMPNSQWHSKRSCVGSMHLDTFRGNVPSSNQLAVTGVRSVLITLPTFSRLNFVILATSNLIIYLWSIFEPHLLFITETQLSGGYLQSFFFYSLLSLSSVHLTNANINHYIHSFVPFSGTLWSSLPYSMFSPSYHLNSLREEYQNTSGTQLTLLFTEGPSKWPLDHRCVYTLQIQQEAWLLF